MRISGVQIDRFGAWSGVHFDNLSDGVTVFYGPNEAGKTTLLQFIRMVLYGYGAGRAERYLRGAGQGMLSAGNRIGGSLAVVTSDDQYHVRRYASQTQPMTDLIGELRVTSRDGSRQGSHRFTTLLSGIDETIFNNVYAVGLREMQYLGTLNDTQASRFLYNLSTGTDRVSLVDVMRQLQNTRSQLIGGPHDETLLGDLLAQRNRHLATVGQLSTDLDRWAGFKHELEQLDDEISRLESSRHVHARHRQILDLALRVEPVWQRHRQLDVEIETLGSVPAVSLETHQQIEELSREIESRAARLEELTQQQQSLQSQHAAAPEDEAFVHHALRIEALLDQRPTVTALDEQLQSLTSRLEEAEFEIQAELERLGLRSQEDNLATPRFDEQTLAALREPARIVEHQRQTLEQSKKEATRLKSDAEQIGHDLAEALGRDPDWFDRREGDVLAAVEQTGNIAKDLRRRLEVERSRKSLTARVRTMDQRRRTILSSQLLPWEVVQALGVLFAVGAMLLLAALFGHNFGWQHQTRTGLAIMGVIGVGFAALLKVLLDGSSRHDLQSCQQQSDTLRRQLEAADNEAEELDRRIPGKRTGPVDIRGAERRLTRLESLMPLENKRRAMLDASQKFQQHAMQIARKLKDSQSRWATTLTDLGLSSRLTPAQVRQLAGETGQLAHLNRECERWQRQIEETQRELAVYERRATDLLADVNLPATSDRVLDQLNQLAGGQRQHEQGRQQIEKQLENQRQLRERQQDLSRELRHLQSQRNALVAAQGAVDDDDLKRLRQRRERWDQLISERQTIADEMAALFDSQADETAVTAELLGAKKTTLAQRVAANQSECARMDGRLKELLVRRGELVEKCRNISEDRQLATTLLDVGMADARLEDGIQQTKIIGVITNLLRSVYKRYEKDRQPKTLKEASQYLERMTNGRYPRIWTPLDEDVLYVDDPTRLAIPVDQLSRGTREQLFLALRLALVSGYARRGVHVPLILDDVLVNFDVQRTKAAAEVLVEFAHTGHQVMIFTCHQHVMDIFGELGVDVRSLTSQGEVMPETGTTTAESVADHRARPPVTRQRSMPVEAPVEFMIGYDDGYDTDSEHLVGYDAGLHEQHWGETYQPHAGSRQPATHVAVVNAVSPPAAVESGPPAPLLGDDSSIGDYDRDAVVEAAWKDDQPGALHSSRNAQRGFRSSVHGTVLDNWTDRDWPPPVNDAVRAQRHGEDAALSFADRPLDEGDITIDRWQPIETPLEQDSAGRDDLPPEDNDVGLSAVAADQEALEDLGHEILDEISESPVGPPDVPRSADAAEQKVSPDKAGDDAPLAVNSAELAHRNELSSEEEAAPVIVPQEMPELQDAEDDIETAASAGDVTAAVVTGDAPSGIGDGEYEEVEYVYEYVEDDDADEADEFQAEEPAEEDEKEEYLEADADDGDDSEYEYEYYEVEDETEEDDEQD